MSEMEKMAEEKENNNIILIGTKPFMNYVTGVVMRFEAKKKSEVIIKARGNFISGAVGVAEAARKRFLEGRNVEVREVKIGSEEMENKTRSSSACRR
jgi:DNA-binding protein Alba